MDAVMAALETEAGLRALVSQKNAGATAGGAMSRCS
jgi:hypothetical protein